MILRKCTSCADATPDPLTWTSSAWNRADGVRVASKHKLCLKCVAAKLAPIHVASESPTMTCPACGIDTSTDMDPVYICWIPKGVGRLQTDAPFCGACAAHYRVWWLPGSEPLDDREPISRGTVQAPRYSTADTLAALGIQLRDNDGR